MLFVVMMVATLFSRLVGTYPVRDTKSGERLNEFIRYYEPAFYNPEHLVSEHRRIRRAAPGTEEASFPLKLTIKTKNRVFNLVLKPDDSLFDKDIILEGEKGRMIDFDVGRVYVGTLEDDARSVVRGILTKEGLFDGTITTQFGEYYIEPISRYKSIEDTVSDDCHTIVYRVSDIHHPNTTYCASSRLHISRKPSDKNTMAYRRKRDVKYEKKNPEFRDLDFVNYGSDQSFEPNNETTLEEWKRKYGNVKQKADNAAKWKGKVTSGSTLILPDKPNSEYNTYHSMDKTFSINQETFYNKKNGVIDPKKTTCMLYLQADHLFFEKYGTEETCIEVMTRHVQKVNSIYKNTDFNQDGKPDNISFMIKRVKVHSIKDPAYRFPGSYGVEKFLEIFSEEDYDAFCLAYMFTYRDFEMGTLGLAWTGDLRNAGGVCEKNGHYRGSLKSLNTGIVTVLNYGKHVPSAVSHVTLAHEIGHNFGSPHDPDGCTPGGDDGNFIMFARATSGDKRNNNRFSNCSISSIDPVLNVKARSSRGCFTSPQRAICGNGVVEPGEECDCGWEEDCKDSCCYPQRRYPPPDEPPCHLTPHSICSPSQGPCCTAECTIKYGDLCRGDNGCRDASYCDGKNPVCPPSINKPNKTVCNEAYVCYMGECTSSICLAYGLESCQCIPTPSDPPTKACELCCKMPGENQPCLSSFLWNKSPYDVPDMFAKPGTPCNNYNGYCDVSKKCREVDPSGPLATLRRLLLSEEGVSSFKKWALQHWYYTTLVVLSFISLMVVSGKYLSKNHKAKTVTVVHQTPTEVVRLPTDGAVVVHPTAVRSKLPLKKKVRENITKEPKTADVRKKPTRKTGNKNSNLLSNPKIKVQEDAIGKVRNWLSQNATGLPPQSNVVNPKEAGKPVDDPPVAGVPTTQNQSPKSSPVRLQVVYKPPFKFSVKFRKNKPSVSTQPVKKVDPKVSQTRIDRIRVQQNPAAKKIVRPRKRTHDQVLQTESTDVKKSSQSSEQAKTEYRRSVSAPAPQVEPVYQNTADMSKLTSGDDKEEPQYVNLIPRNRGGSTRSNLELPLRNRSQRSVKHRSEYHSSNLRQKRLNRSSSAMIGKQKHKSDKYKRYSLQHDSPEYAELSLDKRRRSLSSSVQNMLTPTSLHTVTNSKASTPKPFLVIKQTSSDAAQPMENVTHSLDSRKLSLSSEQPHNLKI